MKLVIRSLVIAALLTSAWGHPESAWAAGGQRVFVERFYGPGTATLRRMVLTALDNQGAQLVSDAERGTAAVVLSGTLTRYRRSFVAVLTAKNPSGQELGRPGVWLGRTVPATLVVAGRNVERKVAATLARAPAGRGGDAVASEAPPKSDGNDQVDRILAEAGRAAKERKRAAASSDEEEEPPRRSRTRPDEPTVAASGDADEPASASLHSFDLTAGTHLYGRTFKYNQNYSGRQDAYEVSVVPSPALSLDYFFTPTLGITLGGEYAVGLSSEHVDGGGKHDTKALGYFVGGLYRYTAFARTELQGGVAYAVNSFSVTTDKADAMAPRLPGVEYKQVRAGGSIRYAATEQISLLGGASYLHLLGAGELATAYFPRATGHGGEGHGGVAFRFSTPKGLEARIMVDLRRYVFAMNSRPGDDHVAGGATDQYLGINVGVGYRP
jgi:hypothetical protein